MLERGRGSDGRSSRQSRSRQDSGGADEASEGRSSDDGWLDRRERCLSDAEKWQDVQRWRELSEACSSLPRDPRRQRRASHNLRSSPRSAADGSGDERRSASGPGARRGSGSPAMPRPEDPTRGDSLLWCQTSSATSTSSASAAGQDSVYELNVAIAAEYNRVFAGTFGAARGPAPPQQAVRRRDLGSRRASRAQRQARSVSVPCRPSSRCREDDFGGLSPPSAGNDAMVLANGPLLLAAIDDDPLCTCECTCESAPQGEPAGVWPPVALAAGELHRLQRLTLGEPAVGQRLASPGGRVDGAAARRGVGPWLVPSPCPPRSAIIGGSPAPAGAERPETSGKGELSGSPLSPEAASRPVSLEQG